MLIKAKEIIGSIERKTVIVGLGKLVMTPYMANAPAVEDLINIICILSKTTSTFTVGQQEMNKDILGELEESGYDATWVRLKAATAIEMDPIKEITDCKEFTVQLLQQLNRQTSVSTAFLKEL